MKKIKPRPPISTILESILSDRLPKKISVSQLIEIFQHRSYGLFILIFAILSILPTSIIPGVSVILGLPITLLGLQLALGINHPWIPKKISEKQIEKEKIKRTFTAIIPRIKTIERAIKPRWFLFSNKIFECLIDLSFAIMGIMLMLPIPFSNMLLGLFIFSLAIGLIERDGVILLFGVIVAFSLLTSSAFIMFSIWKH